MPVQKRVLLHGLAARVVLDYVDRSGAASRQHVQLIRLCDYKTAGGAYRVTAEARIVGEADKRRVVPFLVHRIQAVIDPESGEVHDDVAAYFARLVLDGGGTAPNWWPQADDERFFVADVDIEFGPDGQARGFAFGVGEAFRAALDIVFMRRAGSQCWMRGAPPLLSFAAGDIFYYPPLQSSSGWGAALRGLICVAQVDEAVPDSLDGGSSVPGEVVVSFRPVTQGRLGDPVQLTMTQAEFLGALKGGPPQVVLDLVKETEPGVAS